MSAQIQDLPLLDLFTRLRRQGLPLGIGEYELLLRALQRGYGLPDREALARLCCTLWTSSREEQELLRYHFDQIIAHPPARPSLAEARPAPTWPTAPGDATRPAVLSLDMDLEALEEPGAGGGQGPAGGFGPTPGLPEEPLAAPIAGGEPPRGAFLLGDEYLPVSRRQMKQSWRFLRRPVREGPPVELDVATTIRQIGRHELPQEPALMPRRINRAELLLLADQHGSMTPFHTLTRRLGETALRGGRLGTTGVAYFHNLPEEFLYHDPALIDAEPLAELLARLRPERTAVLIFSDGGAARGRLVPERIAQTEGLLGQLRRSVRRIAWLNPVPARQWPGTSAAAIARRVPMFELSRRGLQGAIDTLRGRTRAAGG